MFKILVVEDEEIIRKGIIYSLDYSKYDCEIIAEATDGKEGMKKIQELSPDIVITDITMPFVSGIDMIEQTYERYDYTAIILSGYNEFEYAQRAINCEVSSYLLKPIDKNLLIDALEKAKQKIHLKHKKDKLEKNVTSIETILSFLPIELEENQNQYTYTTNQIIRYVKENYSEKIDHKVLMDITEKGKTYINTIFKKDTNITINNFITQHRIIKAIELLQKDNNTITQISEMVGFKNYRYFIDVFKKYTGSTPKEFYDKCFKK